MNKNAPKIILAGVLLVAALGLILWNMGVIGGGGSTTLNEDNTVGTTDPEQLEKQNEAADPSENPGSLQGLTKDNF